jgi:hypothetical protein
VSGATLNGGFTYFCHHVCCLFGDEWGVRQRQLMFVWGTLSALEEQRTGFWVRGGGFILDSECTSRVIKHDSKQKTKQSVHVCPAVFLVGFLQQERLLPG